MQYTQQIPKCSLYELGIGALMLFFETEIEYAESFTIIRICVLCGRATEKRCTFDILQIGDSISKFSEKQVQKVIPINISCDKIGDSGLSRW